MATVNNVHKYIWVFLASTRGFFLAIQATEIVVVALHVEALKIKILHVPYIEIDILYTPSITLRRGFSFTLPVHILVSISIFQHIDVSFI